MSTPIQTEIPLPDIRVKVMTSVPRHAMMHQLPGGVPRWGRCLFSLDPLDDQYDWLVVYDDLPARHDEARKKRHERLACPSAHTLLVTSEPISIKYYGNTYTRQFGHVLTSQEDWALPHPGRIYSQPALHWFYGFGKDASIPFDQMASQPPTNKQRNVAMVFSPKSMRHTLHHQRFQFMRRLMEIMPEMDVYGRGAKALSDKADALDTYRYHVAIENYIGMHHWTEKLADAFLGLNLAIYCGCLNAADYFPPDSFISVDINDPEGAARLIRQAIADNEYEKRLPAIIEARRRVMYEYNFFAVLAREIEKRHLPINGGGSQTILYSRHALRHRNPLTALGDLYGKLRARVLIMRLRD